MKRFIKPMAIVVAAASVTAAVLADGHDTRGVFRHVSTIEFEDVIPGTVAFATVAGDRAAGAHAPLFALQPAKHASVHTRR